MPADVATSGAAFFFHLGDVIYEFGEAQYYYDQFYEPFRNYDRPIFAIPGNHDGVVYGLTTTAPAIPSLAAFLANFCTRSSNSADSAGVNVRDTVFVDIASGIVQVKEAVLF